MNTKMKSGLAAFLILVGSMTSAAPSAKADDAMAFAVVAAIFGVSFTSTYGFLHMCDGVKDRVEVFTIIDEAYEGSGPKLLAVAKATGLTMGVVADRIISLNETGALSEFHVHATAEGLAASVNQIVENLVKAKKQS